MKDEIYRSFYDNYRPHHIKINEVTRDLGEYMYTASSIRHMYDYSTVDLTLDSRKFDELAKKLYEIEEEERIRYYTPSVQKAYDEYRMLLELAK
jgi:hypothetical protein